MDRGTYGIYKSMDCFRNLRDVESKLWMLEFQRMVNNIFVPEPSDSIKRVRLPGFQSPIRSSQSRDGRSSTTNSYECYFMLKVTANWARKEDWDTGYVGGEWQGRFWGQKFTTLLCCLLCANFFFSGQPQSDAGRVANISRESVAQNRFYKKYFIWSA